jgi:type VI secretion system protein ImpI/type VI secretion system protein
LLALFAGGSAELLSTISEIKNTFRIDQTQIRQTDNNPLRWSVSPREAVKRLLTPEDDGYLPPRDAVSDAIASIKAHQIGTIRGMESALKQFLREQAPEELEQNFDRQDRPAPWANKSAWNWKQYVDYHSRLSATAQENALELFGGAFSAAYEQQVRIIRGRDRH